MRKNLFKVFTLILISLFICCDKIEDAQLKISYTLPTDVAVNASENQLALFAWKEFFALNWESSWSIDNKRTKPDTLWTLATGGSQPDIAVWETYIHRTELRPANGERTKDLNTGKPDYTFIYMDSINTNGLDLSDYWNVLDEDNEIGSAYVFAHKNKEQVVYAAKSNLAEYNYVKQYFPTDSLLDSASARGSKKGLSYFKGLSKAQMCATDSISSGSDALICLPCSDDNGNDGAIEIKLAFRQLDSTLGDDVNRFITKEAVVFVKNDSTQLYDAEVATFGLIGMHIIRKTTNYPTFVFASWEQVDERNNDIQTIGIDTVTVDSINYSNVEPHRLNPAIERVIPETLQEVNSVVQEKIRLENPSSKWQYYQLIGVQATPIDYNDRTAHNNYFMANFVIESDLKLTNFHGSFGDPFNTDIQNVVADGRSYNMGGCQGCHGQAQTTFGTDFSFLLDTGAGKPVPVPDPYQTCAQACAAACGDDQDCLNTCLQGCQEEAMASLKPEEEKNIVAYMETINED